MILGRRNKLFSRFVGLTAFMTGLAFFKHEIDRSGSKTNDVKVFEGSKLLAAVDETGAVAQKASFVMEAESEPTIIYEDDSIESIETETATQEILPYESSYSVPSFSGYEGVDFDYGDFLFGEALYLNYGEEEEEVLVLANVFSSLLPSPPNFIVENRDGEEIVSVTPDAVISVPTPDSPLAEAEGVGEELVSIASDVEPPSPNSPLDEGEDIGETVSAPPDVELTPPNFHMAEDEVMDKPVSAEPNTEEGDDNREPVSEPIEDKCSLATTHCVGGHRMEYFIPYMYSDSVTDIYLERKSVLTVSLRDFRFEFSDYNYLGEGTIRFTSNRVKFSDIDFSKIGPSLRLETRDGSVIVPPEPMDSSSDISYDSLTDLASMYIGIDEVML